MKNTFTAQETAPNTVIMDADPTRLLIRANPAIMTPEELQQAATEYRKYKRIRDEAEKELETLQAAFVAHLAAIGTDTVNGSDYVATYKTQQRTKLDTKALDADFPGLRARYTVPNPCKAFRLS